MKLWWWTSGIFFLFWYLNCNEGFAYRSNQRWKRASENSTTSFEQSPHERETEWLTPQSNLVSKKGHDDQSWDHERKLFQVYPDVLWINSNLQPKPTFMKRWLRKHIRPWPGLSEVDEVVTVFGPLNLGSLCRPKVELTECKSGCFIRITQRIAV